MAEKLLFRRGWARMHIEGRGGFTRCGRLSEGAEEPPLMSNMLVCGRCHAFKPTSKHASIGVYCQRCHEHTPLDADGSMHAGQIAAFRQKHRACEWKITP
jgi:hypothetical protein